MDKDLLQKHQNDPAWAEVIRLYSGLFDTQDQREDFILDLADKDILLAAECKTSSVEEEEYMVNRILADIQTRPNIKNTPNTFNHDFFALIELGKIDKILTLLKKVESYSKSRKKILVRTIIQENNIEDSLKVLFYLLEQPKRQVQLLFFAFQFFDKEVNEQHLNKISELIKMLIEGKKYRFLQIAESWIEKHKLQSQFPIEKLIQKLIMNNKMTNIKIAESWIAKYQLQNRFSIEGLIKRLIEKGTPSYMRLAKKWIEKYQLQAKFPDITTQKEKLVKNIILNIQFNENIECIISNLIPSRVFVKIENETRPASIYIGELTNQRLSNINDFEYKGEKLHVGQKLVAKVINIDEQGRINLSLKQVKISS